ncbi:putative xylanase/chitin deacetylase [Rubidibacter lacunae KORDI 51-2]|uniref:Putative xylanase/chitin deacetylase n=1 Tax=Rubidibacter lacunae KORDI 51-2 TaxID=582515 RepID=U5DNC2_9CHRO|nr:polysaccharide deacetylase family protein [Rubidibacter lacunae]ERN43161.1 putative xylanase/chitin deacetylase [Rubidibacter lacunae KORDI 51-2]
MLTPDKKHRPLYARSRYARPQRKPLPFWLLGSAIAIASTGLGAFLASPGPSYLWQLARPTTSLPTLVPSLEPLTELVVMRFEEIPAPAPWPEIGDRARLAKVPILMYHDILPEKEVFFDVTPEELEAHFELLSAEGVRPVSIDAVVKHLRTGVPLPPKPVLLTFDDGYGGHYEYVYPLLQRFEYPAVLSIYVNKMDQTTGRSSVTWEQLAELAADPLVTIASHSISHPNDLRPLPDAELREEVFVSKQILEERLGIEIDYFTYPVGKSDERVRELVAEAGYVAALSMDDYNEDYAGTSDDLLQIARFGQSRIEEVIESAWGGFPLARRDGAANFTTPIRKQDREANGVRVRLIRGGRPTTIHADSRYQVAEILAGTDAIAAVDGGFFSLRDLKANTMIGPVLSAESQNWEEFVPGNPGENPLLRDRPLVLIGSDRVAFVPFDPDAHNTRTGLSDALPTVTDAFVAAAWLVRDGSPQSRATFRDLYGFDAIRFRAFWGIDRTGQPVIGVTTSRTDSVTLGQALHELDFRDAVMLDSGASTSLVYEGASQVEYTPRPVPHVVALFPPEVTPSDITGVDDPADGWPMLLE